MKQGSKVRFANVAGGFFDKDYQIHVLNDFTAVLADYETGTLLLQGENKARIVPLSALALVSDKKDGS